VSENSYRRALIAIRDRAKSLGPEFEWVYEVARRAVDPNPATTTGVVVSQVRFYPASASAPHTPEPPPSPGRT
jgi:hypothetical protein